jgi:hypothetical protein
MVTCYFRITNRMLILVQMGNEKKLPNHESFFTKATEMTLLNIPPNEDAMLNQDTSYLTYCNNQ